MSNHLKITFRSDFLCNNAQRLRIVKMPADLSIDQRALACTACHTTAPFPLTFQQLQLNNRYDITFVPDQA
jgi:hypothetical protein